MKFERLTKEQLNKIYVERMTEDFPEAELKPLGAMYDMMDRDCYEALAVLDDEGVIGYSLMTKIPGQNYLLLDYLSIYKEFRQCGYGSKVLEGLKVYYSGKTIFIESENPDYIGVESHETAVKRVGFYEKNGVKDTGVLTRIWTVPYINYILGEVDLSKEQAKRALEVIYETMIPNKFTRDKMIEIPQRTF